MKLLKTLTEIHAPAGEEQNLTKFLLKYINKECSTWKVKPIVHSGKKFQNCIVLSFGVPRTAVFAHIDSIGFTVRYGKQLVKLGGPRTEKGYKLYGNDSKGEINCTLVVDKEGKLSYKHKRSIETGTNLTFKPNFKETKNYIQSNYLDNRLGVWNALRLCETIENGIVVFSCWEEVGGGSVEYLAKFIAEEYSVYQALISDITWVTEGVKAGKGCAISMRDSGIPRREYVNRIIEIAKKAEIPFQLEVENAGGSDGNILHKSPYPFDWCFVGAPEQNVHSPKEKVHKTDIESMLRLYKVLIDQL